MPSIEIYSQHVLEGNLVQDTPRQTHGIQMHCYYEAKQHMISHLTFIQPSTPPKQHNEKNVDFDSCL